MLWFFLSIRFSLRHSVNPLGILFSLRHSDYSFDMYLQRRDKTWDRHKISWEFVWGAIRALELLPHFLKSRDYMPPPPAGMGRFDPWGKYARETLGPRTKGSTAEGGTEWKSPQAFSRPQPPACWQEDPLSPSFGRLDNSLEKFQEKGPIDL